MTIQEILEELETLRYGYLNGRPDPVAADARLASLVQSLIDQGHYPHQTKLGKHPATMVRGYGPRWNVWQGLIFCPYCAADLRDHGAGPPFLRTAAAVLGERCCPDCLTLLGAPQPAKIPG